MRLFPFLAKKAKADPGAARIGAAPATAPATAARRPTNEPDVVPRRDKAG